MLPMDEPKISFPEFVAAFEGAVRELVTSWEDHQRVDPDTFLERMTATEWMEHVNMLVDLVGDQGRRTLTDSGPPPIH